RSSESSQSASRDIYCKVTARGGWKSFTTITGALCATTTGTSGMPRWFAGRWAVAGQCPPLSWAPLVTATTPSCWTTSTAKAPRLPSSTASTWAGGSTTAGTMRTPGCGIFSPNVRPGWQPPHPLPLPTSPLRTSLCANCCYDRLQIAQSLHFTVNPAKCFETPPPTK
uniref:Uncharacterized protein n=1 Tax=Callorhinchus milii TaxID=7868 RepID=A0A4W3JNR2_CALMI